jgi:hypothetical protein
MVPSSFAHFPVGLMLHILVNNAGVMGIEGLTSDGTLQTPFSYFYLFSFLSSPSPSPLGLAFSFLEGNNSIRV